MLRIPSLFTFSLASGHELKRVPLPSREGALSFPRIPVYLVIRQDCGVAGRQNETVLEQVLFGGAGGLGDGSLGLQKSGGIVLGEAPDAA